MRHFKNIIHINTKLQYDNVSDSINNDQNS